MAAAHDVFLCHNSTDKAAVKAIGRELRARGLRPWLDEWELQPGLPWQRELERQIKTIRSAAVLVGESGFGPWQSEELESFLRQFVKRRCPVIPVVLPECATVPELPAFLDNRTWVDFRTDDPDPWERLIWGITGERPAPEPRTEVASGEAAVLAAWRHHVERTNSHLTEAFERPGVPRLLDHIYVELRLVDRELLRLAGGRQQATGGSTALPEHPDKLGARLTLEEVLGLDPADFPAGAITGRWLLFGDPGSGKTTLLRHLAWKLARSAGPGDARWLPVFASLPRLVRAGGWFLDLLCEELGATSHSPAAMRKALDGSGHAGRLLLLFDGLDEVPVELRGRADALIGDSSDRWPKAAIVVTSRPIGGYRPAPELRELELLPFGAGDRRRFLARWLGDDERAREALERVRREPSLWELAGNPLYLTLLAMLFDEQVEIPARRAALYDRILAHLLGGKHRKEQRPIPRPVLVRGVLRHLACEMTEAGRDGEPVEVLEERLWTAERLMAELGKVTRWRQDPGAFLAEVAVRTSILAQHDGPGADWRYWHRTFREALAAEALGEQLETGGEVALLARAREVTGNLGRWAEPYALLVGRVEQPDALVKTLMEVNRPLGLRALAGAQGLAPETIDEILGLTGDWQERSKVFRRIPELLEDAEASLRLIERLRRRTTETHDLFFLEAAAREVAGRWPQSARAVDRLCRRFYADREPPPEDLFSRVQTPLDGRVDLWRDVEAGRFLMGSPQSEPDYDEETQSLGAYGNERPQHEVEISQPFRLMTVPVTHAMYRMFDATHVPERWKGVGAQELWYHPAVNVDWYQAAAFCRWLERHGFTGARLPTEAEWEYACRAGTSTRYWSGDSEQDLERVAWYRANVPSRTHRVGEKPANPWGLYDMHGNVWEWCADGWDVGAYAKRAGKQPAIDPRTDEDVWNIEANRVLRGGAWGVQPQYLRAAFRSWRWVRDRFWVVGFRVCVSGPEHA